MDKKKQFQIENLKSKLQVHYGKYRQLNSSYNDLLQQQKLINPNLETIKQLKDNKDNLETQIRNNKKTISNLNNQRSDNKHKLEKIPQEQATKINDEINIKQDELERIENQRIYENIELKQSLEGAELDRLQLVQEINIVKKELECQNQVICDLQISAHAARKGVLADLHQKKQNKLAIKEEQDNLQNQIAIVNKQNDELRINLEKLAEFKRMIVDMNYHSNTDKEKLDSYYVEFNIPKKTLINEKLKLIDSLIVNLKRKKEIMNRRFDRNKKAQEERISDIINNYNTVHRVKVIGYKDQYKAEKGRRDNLLEILNDLQNRYDNFDNDIIENINETFSRTINTLNEDILRAEERLDIMTNRINNKYEEYKTYLEQEEININQMITKLSLEINMANEQIKQITMQIEKEDALGIEAEKIKVEMDKYEALINQIESDLVILEA